MTLRHSGHADRRSAILVTLAILLLGPSRASAQTPSDQTSGVDQRSQLFREIAAEVAELERQGNLLKKVVRYVKPSVVHIEAKKTTPSNVAMTARRSVEEAGSGVIVELEERRFVLTNRHVIKDSELNQIKIQLSDGRVIYPTRVWSDRQSDVAVMEVSARELVPAKVGNSDGLDIGDFVLAVGSPFGLSHSVTYGIISAKGRRDLKLGNGDVKYQDFLQTDAAINPGNSGGPLLNLRGEVVGINTAIASSSGGSEGIGFTIPINMFVSIAEQLVQSGNVRRAYLGVRLDRRFNAAQADELGLPITRGALVTDVTANSPAARARLQVGDIIVKVDNTDIEGDDHLVNLISLLPIDRQIGITLYRDGKPLTLSARVGDRGDFEQE
jgi:serine protease Do